jgi:diaminopimelate epimerase
MIILWVRWIALGLMSQETVYFQKMNGLGNKILVVDMRNRSDKILPAAAINLAAKEKTSFDQIMAVHSPATNDTDAYIHILNSDGSDAEACGNGTRCVVSWLHQLIGKNSFIFDTAGGVVKSTYQNIRQIEVNMGTPRFEWDEIPLAEEFADTRTIELQIGPIDDPVLHTPSAANIGNPHAVFWVEGDVWSYDLERFGPMLENHPIFPERANITIANVTSPTSMIIRTWERGAGITKACGSAACAAAVSAVRTERTGRKVKVSVPGGDLDIEWLQDDTILMTGPAEYEFSGQLDPSSGSWSMEQEAR